MGRKVSDWQEVAVSYLGVKPYASYKSFEDFHYSDGMERVDAIRAVRKQAPYQPGDVLYIKRGDGNVLARVHQVHGEWQHVSGDLIPFWRMQYATKAGVWSRDWIKVYPGDIYRAYQSRGEIGE